LTAESSIFYKPQNVDELSCFFKVNKEKYLEIWVVLAKKQFTNPQPVSFNQAVGKTIEQGLVDSRTKTLDKKDCYSVYKREKIKDWPVSRR
jgi:hypothetical protein